MQAITPCLWFDDNAEEAVNFYVSIFKNTYIKKYLAMAMRVIKTMRNCVTSKLKGDIP